MFNFNRQSSEPLDSVLRKFFENNLLWLNQEFPDPPIKERKVFTTLEDLNITKKVTEDKALQVLKLVATQMQLEPAEINLTFFENPTKEIDTGSSTIFLETDPETPEAAGLYHHKDENGIYTISLDAEILERPEAMVATLAHELAHVKLLGQLGLEENDEHLTDLATVYFGFGVLGANNAFQFYQTADRWGYRNLGYLKQEEWAYALALFAYIRYEDEPSWSPFLNKTIKKDFDRSLKFIQENTDKIFQFHEEKDS